MRPSCIDEPQNLPIALIGDVGKEEGHHHREIHARLRCEAHASVSAHNRQEIDEERLHHMHRRMRHWRFEAEPRPFQAERAWRTIHTQSHIDISKKAPCI
jgi:hypothetical protein